MTATAFAFQRVAADIRSDSRDRAAAMHRTISFAAEDVAAAASDAFLNASPRALNAACAVEAVSQVFDDDAVVILAALFDAMRKHNTHIEERHEAMVLIAAAVEVMVPLVRRES